MSHELVKLLTVFTRFNCKFKWLMYPESSVFSWVYIGKLIDRLSHYLRSFGLLMQNKQLMRRRALRHFAFLFTPSFVVPHLPPPASLLFSSLLFSSLLTLSSFWQTCAYEAIFLISVKRCRSIWAQVMDQYPGWYRWETANFKEHWFLERRQSE